MTDEFAGAVLLLSFVGFAFAFMVCIVLHAIVWTIAFEGVWAIKTKRNHKCRWIVERAPWLAVLCRDSLAKCKKCGKPHLFTQEVHELYWAEKEKYAFGREVCFQCFAAGRIEGIYTMDKNGKYILNDRERSI